MNLWRAGSRVLSRSFGACKLYVGDAAPRFPGFEWTVSTPQHTVASGYAKTMDAAKQKALQSDNPPDDLLPGRTIWDLRVELRQTLKDLASDDACLHPRDPLV